MGFSYKEISTKSKHIFTNDDEQKSLADWNRANRTAAGWSCDCQNICENRVKCRRCVCVWVYWGGAHKLSRRQKNVNANWVLTFSSSSSTSAKSIDCWWDEWMNELTSNTQICSGRQFFHWPGPSAIFFPQLMARLKTRLSSSRDLSLLFFFLVTFRCSVLNGSSSTLCDISMLTFHANFFLFFITPIFAR